MYTLLYVLNMLYIITIISYAVKQVIIKFLDFGVIYKWGLALIYVCAVLNLHTSNMFCHYATIDIRAYEEAGYSIFNVLIYDFYALILFIVGQLIYKKLLSIHNKKVEENEKDERHQRWQKFMKNK